MQFKHIIIGIFLAGIAFSCGEGQEKTTDNGDTSFDFWVFGDTISPEASIKASEIVNLMTETDYLETSIEGKVANVCQTKGCWMTIELEDGEVMRMTFKDYGFFVPKDIHGKTIIAEGFAYTDTISVESLKHYAMDAEWDQEEIDAITEPEIELLFEAHGVLLLKEE